MILKKKDKRLFVYSETGLIPEEILWRPKEAFSDGVSSQRKSWYETLQDYAAEQVSGKSSLFPNLAKL